MRYVIIDNEGNIVNAIVWDGESEWSPPEGCTVEQSDTYAKGGTLIDGVYTPPAEPGE